MNARAHALLYFLNELGRTDRTSSSDILLKCRKLLHIYHARIKRKQNKIFDNLHSF